MSITERLSFLISKDEEEAAGYPSSPLPEPSLSSLVHSVFFLVRFPAYLALLATKGLAIYHLYNEEVTSNPVSFLQYPS